MLISIEWLKEYVDIPWGVQQLADRLTQIGIKVEKIITFDENLANVVVGRIDELLPHPSAGDDLFVCTVDLGENKVRCVTGASNVHEGMIVAVALPGATLPGASDEVRLAEIAGVRSEAIICSERELGISDDHSGVMSLAEDIEIGLDITTALGLNDTVLELETYPNRPDTLSVIGIAREVAAITNGEVRLPSLKVEETSEEKVRDYTSVEVKDGDLCSRYVARIVTGVKIGPSPAWLQRRLRAVGMRPINNVVDVTNYCLMELGQPLHAFDHKQLTDGVIVVRRAENNEKITTLDGDEHELSEDVLVICDASRPVAIAGVMGGGDSEVTESTTTVLLEAATFDPVQVRKTAKKLDIHTESGYRFERDLDPHLSGIAADRAASLLANLTGGKVLKERIDVKQPLPKPTTIKCDPKKINRLLGTKLSPVEMKRILKGLGFDVEILQDPAILEVQVPTFRRDIAIEADVAEEVARIYGFHEIPATLPKGSTILGGLNPKYSTLNRIRQTLMSHGCFESITYSFISPRLFDRVNVGEDHPWRQAIELANPISEEHRVMRTTLLPSLLQAVGTNFRRQVNDVRLFELGKIYVADELPPTTLPEEKETLAVVLSGRAMTDVWGMTPRPLDFYDLKGMIESLGETMGIRFRFVVKEHPAFHPGRTAAILAHSARDGEMEIGLMGEVHPDVAGSFDIKGRLLAAEIDIETLLNIKREPFQYEIIARYPAVVRDLAILVPHKISAEQVFEVLQSADATHLKEISLFDVYEGDQVPEGMRSLAFSLTYQAENRTMTDEEVLAQQAKIEKSLSDQLGIEMRR